MESSRMKDIIIDTDPGCDDALALAYAFRSGHFNVRALTTVCGNAALETVTNNAIFVRDFFGASAVPVWSGARAPLAGALSTAVVHGENALGRLSPQRAEPDSSDAVAELARLLSDEPGCVTIVALGPLTNLASLMRRFPGAIEKAKQLMILGGALRPPGNKGPVAEFNFFVDPEAAHEVLEASVPKTLVTLDACLQVVLQREDFLEIKDGRLRQFALDLMEPYVEANEREEGIRGAIMYDPLALYVLANPEGAVAREYSAVVETKGEYTRGMLVADQRAIKHPRLNIRVAEAVNSKQFRDEFLRALNQRSALDS